MTLPIFTAERGRLQQILMYSWYTAPAAAAIDGIDIRNTDRVSIRILDCHIDHALHNGAWSSIEVFLKLKK